MYVEDNLLYWSLEMSVAYLPKSSMQGLPATIYMHACIRMSYVCMDILYVGEVV